MEKPDSLVRSGAEVHISEKGRRWLMSGHLWCFASDVERVRGCEGGDMVRVVSGKDRFVAYAMFSAGSKISLRIVSRRADDVIDAGFVRGRILASIARRGDYARGNEARRLVFSESDQLPGLIVDDYAGHMVVQSMTAGADRLLDIVKDTLSSLGHAKGILFRLDAPGRAREGLAVEKKVAYGTIPERVAVSLSGGARVYVDCMNGHKTGIYLDQRLNWEHAGRLSRGKVLDAFAYQGNFSVCAAGTAESVVGIDSSPEAEKLFGENMSLNSLSNVSFMRENAFDCLRAFDDEGRRFDTVILDPPSFARDKKSLEGALRGFKEINLRAMKLLNPGGRLLTFSCSQALGRELFCSLLREAAADCGREFVVREEFTQSPDHPVLLAMPETGYLRGFCLERV